VVFCTAKGRIIHVQLGLGGGSSLLGVRSSIWPYPIYVHHMTSETGGLLFSFLSWVSLNWEQDLKVEIWAFYFMPEDRSDGEFQFLCVGDRPPWHINELRVNPKPQNLVPENQMPLKFLHFTMRLNCKVVSR
jgi:hypothetical protein